MKRQFQRKAKELEKGIKLLENKLCEYFSDSRYHMDTTTSQWISVIHWKYDKTIIKFDFYKCGKKWKIWHPFF